MKFIVDAVHIATKTRFELHLCVPNGVWPTIIVEKAVSVASYEALGLPVEYGDMKSFLMCWKNVSMLVAVDTF